jgi:hypothetical protein
MNSVPRVTSTSEQYSTCYSVFVSCDDRFLPVTSPSEQYSTCYSVSARAAVDSCVLQCFLRVLCSLAGVLLSATCAPVQEEAGNIFDCSTWRPGEEVASSNKQAVCACQACKWLVTCVGACHSRVIDLF